MTNHGAILNTVKKSKKYSYDELKSIAVKRLPHVTAGGREYAILKFIQIYCDVLFGVELQTITRKGDPRTVLDKERLKQCKFRLKTTNKERVDSSIKTVKAANNARIADKQNLNNLSYDDPICCDKDHFMKETKDFRKWLIGALSKFNHKWIARSGNNQSGVISGNQWSSSSLFSAYQQYVWPAAIQDFPWEGRFFYETEQILVDLRKKLKRSIRDNDGETTRKICHQILQWGGVDNRPSVAPNIKHEIPARNLPQHLKETQDYLNKLISKGCSNSYNAIFVDNNNYEIVVDSGTTKIYSLICKDFIIYDSRVASALAYLVKCWWEETKMRDRNPENSYENISPCLRFSCVITNQSFRNPNPNGHTIFRNLTNPGTRRTRENIQASWLLHQLLKDDENQHDRNKSGFAFIKNQKTRLRALEAALFMIGYHVS